MNNVCPNCGIIGPNFSCPNHTYCWGTGNTQSPTIQPQVTWMPVSDQINESSLFAEIGRLNVLLNERNKEIERLKGLMPPDERGPGFVGQGSWSVFAEKVVAERDQLQGILAYLRSMKVIDGLNRILPLEGHHKDCGHGKDGWSLCTCDELKKVDEERANKQFQLLVEEGQNLRKEFDKQTAGMRGPPQCSKCGDTGLVSYGPNIRGMKHCDCKRTGVRQSDSLKELDELKEKDWEIERLRGEVDQLNREAHIFYNLRDNLFVERAELKECLRWYVENDDTNEGGKWEESNAHWLEGRKRRAMRALGKEGE